MGLAGYSGYGCPKVVPLQETQHIRIVFARWIRHENDRLAGMALNGLSPTDDLKEQPLSGAIAHVVVIACVELHIHPCAAHRLNHIPRQIRRVAIIGRACQHKERADHAVFLQERESIGVVVHVAVVKRQHDRFPRQRPANHQIFIHVAQSDGREAVIVQQFQLRLEHFWRRRQPVANAILCRGGSRDIMIHEDRHSGAALHTIRLRRHLGIRRHDRGGTRHESRRRRQWCGRGRRRR